MKPRPPCRRFQSRPASVLVATLLGGVLLGVAGVNPAGSQAQQPAPPADPSPLATPFPPAPPPPADPSLFPGPGVNGRPPPPPLTAVPGREAPLTGASGGAAGPRRRGSSSGGPLSERRNRGASPALNRAGTDPLEVRVAFRRAKTEALRDPRLAELQRQAEAAPTDEEKRAVLRRYYQELFARVLRLNPSPEMKAHVNLLTRAAEQRYAPQRRAGGEDELENTRGRNRR